MFRLRLLPAVLLIDDPEAARCAPSFAMTREREMRGRRTGSGRGFGLKSTFEKAVAAGGAGVDANDGVPPAKIVPGPPLGVETPPTSGGDIDVGIPLGLVERCPRTFPKPLPSGPATFRWDATLVKDGGRTVLCIRARELAVGAKSVDDVRFLTTLLALPVPTSPIGVGTNPAFLMPIELAVAPPLRELVVPPPLVRDPVVPPPFTRLLVRDMRPAGCWKEGMGPRRAGATVENAAEETVLDRPTTEAALDLVPIIEFVPVLVTACRPTPSPVEGPRRLVFGSGLVVDVVAGVGFAALDLIAELGLMRTLGVGFLLAVPLCEDFGGSKVDVGFGTCVFDVPTPLFQTFLTRVFAAERKPNLVAIPFFADNIKC